MLCLVIIGLVCHCFARETELVCVRIQWCYMSLAVCCAIVLRVEVSVCLRGPNNVVSCQCVVGVQFFCRWHAVCFGASTTLLGSLSVVSGYGVTPFGRSNYKEQ